MDGQRLLAYEVEHWDTQGESLIWVCVPQISSSEDAILAWWGHADAPEQDYNAQGLAWVRDKQASQYRLYIDGTPEGTSEQAGTDITFTTRHQIGSDNRSGDSPNFHGLLDDMRIAPRALSQSELQFYWQNTQPHRESVTYWED